MFVVTNTFSGFVANQVRYNFESAQYLRYSYYITIVKKYILDLYIECHGSLSATFGFMKFYKQHLSCR